MAKYVIGQDPAWRNIHLEILLRGKSKDRHFILTGKWKKFLRLQSGYKIFIVDGKWVRTNLCVSFSHGGHGLVHEFIPMDEIWLPDRHYDEGPTHICQCGCKVKKKNMKVSKNFLESSIVHEITEVNLMKKGMEYFRAHQHALAAERKLGLLKDPFDDT